MAAQTRTKPLSQSPGRLIAKPFCSGQLNAGGAAGLDRIPSLVPSPPQTGRHRVQGDRPRSGTLFAGLTLLLIAAAVMPRLGQAQSGFGSLAGKLTDTYSSPLENVTITLRNAATGSEITATTSRGGKYRFTHLAAGEYTLQAAGPHGIRNIDGIVIAPNHQSIVQTMIESGKLNTASVLIAEAKDPSPGRSLNAERRLPVALLAGPPPQAQVMPDPQVYALVAEAAVAPESLFAVPVPQHVAYPRPKTELSPEARPSIPDWSPATPPPAYASPAFVSHFGDVSNTPLETEARLIPPDLENVNLATIPAEVLGTRTTPPEQVTAIAGTEDQQTLESTQIERLPSNDRNWKSLLPSVPPAERDEDDRPAPSAQRIQQSITLDGVSLQSAFAGTSSSSSIQVETGGESAIRELQATEIAGGVSKAYSSGVPINIATRQGTDRLNGQVFLLGRSAILGARNPLTQWVHETAPASGSRVPVFTPVPYSPADQQLFWGAGIGGVLHRAHLFWFGALDGYERRDPAVATVKHPDHFFAQPANDQMQLLSAQLGLSSADPVGEGVAAYSGLLESLSTLLGPAQRNSTQWNSFGRIDWNSGERHRLTFEASGANLDAPRGAFTRASEAFGNHSFGSARATERWLIGRWNAFITPNLLATTQGSIGTKVRSNLPDTPSEFEQAFNITAWGQLPQIVVDSRYGFTIGNPARFGHGSYPDETLYSGREQVSWVHGKLMLNSGAELRHAYDATTRLRNQTGTYFYSSIEDFASDALAYSAFGFSGQLNPMDQHNCDQRGKAWRDTSGALHGLGYLPCYSYYSQTIGPSQWWLSTNDWAAYTTAQWQANRKTTLSLAMRWELEQAPPPISILDNPDLPLTQRTPALGSQWGPRVGFAWESGESRWPVVRLGYGIYFSRTRNSVLETALTQTGSLKGDLSFFMRPTDNLHGGGAPPFPYVLAGPPASTVKPSPIEFAPQFRNGEVQQAELAIEEALPGHLQLEAAAIGSLGRRLPVTVDANVDPATNPKTITYTVIDGNGSGPIKSPQVTVPFFASWPSAATETGFAGRLNPNYQQVSEVFSSANSTYEALVFRLSRNARAMSLRARYTYAHAMDWNPDETSQLGAPSVLDPIDFRQEYGISNLDIRHSFATTLILQPKWKLGDLAGRVVNGWMLSGVGHFYSGMPYTMRTAGSLAKEFDVNGTAIVGLSTNMNGYGGDNRIYGIGRNTYRYPATWKMDLRLAKKFGLGQMRQLELLAESFNLFNHQNVTELETVGYSIESGTANGALPRLNFLTGLKNGQTEFGKPLNSNATNFYRERQLQFGARLRF